MAQTRDPHRPRQPHLVSEGRLTCQRGSREEAATAACDPKFLLPARQRICDAAFSSHRGRAAHPHGSGMGHHGKRNTCSIIRERHGRVCWDRDGVARIQYIAQVVLRSCGRVLRPRGNSRSRRLERRGCGEVALYKVLGWRRLAAVLWEAPSRARIGRGRSEHIITCSSRHRSRGRRPS